MVRHLEQMGRSGRLRPISFKARLLPRHPDHDALLNHLKPGLHVHQEQALNAEPAPHRLDAQVTPFDAFFVRNNGDLPATGADVPWTLTIDGEVEHPLTLTLSEIQRDFEVVTQTAVLECAGNGRSQFQPQTEGLPWGLGAVGCARWTGVRLRDVLTRAGVRPGAVYTGHESPDRQISAPTKPALSRGLPIAKAMSEETLLAFAMNDAPLHRLHGAPLRIVAPGFPGSAWQKWLSRIRLRSVEHDGEKMLGTNYRLPLAPVLPGQPIDESLYAVITEMPVKSLITTPGEGFRVGAGKTLHVGGFAWSGGVGIDRVRVSCDGGGSWRDAALSEPDGPYAWCRFGIDMTAVEAGPLTIVAIARDRLGGEQPLTMASWNPRGYCNNQAHRVSGTVE